MKKQTTIEDVMASMTIYFIHRNANVIADSIYRELNKQLKPVKHLNTMFNRDQLYLVLPNNNNRTYKHAALTQSAFRKALKQAMKSVK